MNRTQKVYCSECDEVHLDYRCFVCNGWADENYFVWIYRRRRWYAPWLKEHIFVCAYCLDEMIKGLECHCRDVGVESWREE